MVRFPHAKINLGLSVVSRRPDGFHDIETVFYPIPLYDVVEILPDEQTSLSISGMTVPGSTADNLLTRAWNLVKVRYPLLPPLRILLHKSIPMGAGLGGGSSDAASVLVMINDLFKLGMSADDLRELAAVLGSDCPFFLASMPQLGTGKGENLEPVSLDLSAYDLLLVHPPVSIPTAWAYGRITPSRPAVSVRTLIDRDPADWKGLMKNDFEEPVFSAYPELAEIKSDLYRQGAKYAAMSGSGSTFFGLFAADSCPQDAMTGKNKTRLLKRLSADRLW